MLRLLIELFLLRIQCYNFPLSTTSLYPTNLDKLCFHFPVQNIKKFLMRVFSLIPCIIKKCTASSPNTLGFPALLLLFVSNLITLWSESRRVIFILLNVVRRILWHRMLSVLVNVPCNLEKNVYSVVIGWTSLYMSVIPSWLMVVLSTTVS